MSISPILLKSGLWGLKEKLGFELNIHRHEIVVGAIMITISFAIALALTGDFNEAYSKAKRR
ncbi:MAG TPA: hypothetical protein VH415_02765 [Nitrososphaeraceae archaeon]|jgi:hypothetical protein